MTGPSLDLRHFKNADGYTMQGVCFNCGERVVATFQKGYRTSRAICPRCGCCEVGGWKQHQPRRGFL